MLGNHRFFSFLFTALPVYIVFFRYLVIVVGVIINNFLNSSLKFSREKYGSFSLHLVELVELIRIGRPCC
jgi:hypothetical protein